MDMRIGWSTDTCVVHVLFNYILLPDIKIPNGFTIRILNNDRCTNVIKKSPEKQEYIFAQVGTQTCATTIPT